MDSTENRAQRNKFHCEPASSQAVSRTIPIIQDHTTQTPSLKLEDPMDVVPSSSVMVPQARSIPENETNGAHDPISLADQTHSVSLTGPNTPIATGAPQTKVVQTAFIHKLYSMLEDQSIQHLISWSNSAESFVMSPSNDFSKVLSQYFKHTNISSFVRQLNMYGFHKVSDVFHTGSPDSPLWEFKHGNGNFKRGDLVGLREIKRRASRHALVHRDSYSGPKPPLPQTGPSIESMHTHQIQMHDSTESRLTNLEQTTYEMHALLQKAEENSNTLQARNQIVMEALSRSLQLNHEISRLVLSMVPHSSVPIHRDMANLQAEIQRQVEIIRSLDEHTEPPPAANQPFLSNLSLENGSVSPRQTTHDDSRRGPPITFPPRHNYYNRPPIPSLFSTAPHAVGSSNSHSSPSSLRSQAPFHPPQPHLNSMANLSPPTNIMRRHTSADIRNVQGWQSSVPHFGLGPKFSQWPPSPRRAPIATSEEQQHIRDSFSSYSLTTASSQLRNEGSRPATPPSYNCSSSEYLNSYTWASGKEKLSSSHKETSAPPARRGIMAHILNPAETADLNEEHDETLREDDRKRKRV